MDPIAGGIFTPKPIAPEPETTVGKFSRASRAAAARARVLAIYNSATKSLKKSKNPDSASTITPPVPGNIYSAQATQTSQPKPSEPESPAGAFQLPKVETVASPVTPDYSTPASYTVEDTTSALKDTPIQQAAVDSNWQQYHSAWQNYYQNYYSDYYAKAALNYLESEKLKHEQTASGRRREKRRVKHLLPLALAVSAIAVFLFLEYNRLLFAPIMAYVAPDSGSTSGIESVDSSVALAVSADPRLIIPKLNVDVPVAFGIDYNSVMDAMNYGVAHFMIPGANAFPGEIGNLVISGHSAGDIYSSNPYKFIFSGLERLENGDLIYVNYNSVRYTYKMVRHEVVEPTNVAALIYETDRPMLTLITCTPLGTSRFRLLITAEQISPSYIDSSSQAEPSTSDIDIALPANEPTLLERLFGN